MEVLEFKVKNLIKKLKKENDDRSIKINATTDDYSHTVLVHTYNTTLDFIKELERLIK